ncbi:DUF2179 domain-containing protein [Pontiella agarivorans]|uniref:UPF0316 protein P9H32_06315 n=1 Tax=Pontiella agarivorans TaxID=3038953 RepID=A0ABU5MVM0_9BACT|nr:DUF2179 domain-containing protein [Pontiella agarivorans]MDZ8118240.1 DUF2179 domain-containing protein [Pontiella agarivorans]
MDAFKEAWWLLPLFIFTARTVDVGLGTLRVIFISRGHQWLGPLTGFFEILVWLLAVSQIMSNLDNWICFMAYPSGYAAGAYFGMFIERRLALGYVVVRIIPNGEPAQLAKQLRADGFGITTVDAEGANGRVSILFSVVRRKKLAAVLRVIKNYHRKVFYTIEDVRQTSEGIHPVPAVRRQGPVRPGK